MQHHLHLKCLLSLLQIFSFNACHFIAPGYLKKWCWISYCRNISTAKGKLLASLALLGCGFNYLSSCLRYSRETLSFYAFDTPLFLVSKQWDWFDWFSVFISRAWWSPECEGCLYSSGRAQSAPRRKEMLNLNLFYFIWNKRHALDFTSAWRIGWHWHIHLV